jgi:hypothetical protein
VSMGSPSYPIGPIQSESLTSNYSLQVRLNGSLYKILLRK